MSDADDPLSALHRLLGASLSAWRVLARISRAPDGAIVVSGLGPRITVRRAGPELPFRWLIGMNGRERPALSVVTVLRQVRAALDPGFAPGRVRFAPPRDDGGTT